MVDNNSQEGYNFLSNLGKRLVMFTKDLCGIPNLKPILERLIILAEKEMENASGSELEQIKENISVYESAIELYVRSNHYGAILKKERIYSSRKSSFC